MSADCARRQDTKSMDERWRIKVPAASALLPIVLLLSDYIILSFSTGVPTSCLPGCVCVNESRQITCDEAGFEVLPAAWIPSAVTSLALPRNALQRVGPLDGFVNLVELRLSGNQIRVLRRGALDPVSSTLQLLDLSSNNLTTLEDRSLNVAAGLLHVDLSDNQLTDIDGAFAGLAHLSRLDLRRNLLSAVSVNSLFGLSSLRYLRLDDNRIAAVDDRAFLSLDQLMYLVLRGNPLGGGNTTGFHFSSRVLSYVDLSQCDLERFPSGLPASVRYLQLRRNRIQTLSRRDLVDVSASLNILVLDENQLESIDDEALATATHLEQLWLNGNRLQSVPRSLPVALKRLFIDSNRLGSLTAADFPPPVESGSRRQLSTLSAMSNNISVVTGDALRQLGELVSLDLAANNIRELRADTFASNRRLRTVTLSKNPLEQFGARCLADLGDLQTLSLAYVASTEVVVAADAFGDSLDSLRKLDLNSSPALVEALMESRRTLVALGDVQDLVLLGSELRSLDAAFPTWFAALAVLHVSSSRWHCDASMRWFRNWLLSTSVHVEPSPAELLCASPAAVRGRALVSLSDDELDATGLAVDGVSHSQHARRHPPTVHSGASTTSSHAPHHEIRAIVSLSDEKLAVHGITVNGMGQSHYYKHQPRSPSMVIEGVSTASSLASHHNHVASASFSDTDLATTGLHVGNSQSQPARPHPRPPPPVDRYGASTTSSVAPHHNDVPLTWEEVLARMSQPPPLLDLGRDHASTSLTSRIVTAASDLDSSLQSRSTVNNNVLLIIFLTVLVTTLLAAAILAVIVRTCRKQPSAHAPPKRTSGTTGNRNATKSLSKQNGYASGSTYSVAKTGKQVVYFVANGDRRVPEVGGAARVGKDKFDTAVELTGVSDGGHQVTLLRNMATSDSKQKGSGPLRVYKWEDF